MWRFALHAYILLDIYYWGDRQTVVLLDIATPDDNRVAVTKTKQGWQKHGKAVVFGQGIFKL